ncbi:MAG: YfhO family protein [Chitinophagaceae bacterium]
MIKSLWQKAWPHVTVIVLFLVVAIVYCKPALEGKVLQQTDIIHWKGVAQQSFEYKEKYGHLPLWSNSMFSGMPAYLVAMERTSAISLSYLHSIITLGLPKPISFFFLACVMFYIMCQALRINPWISAGAAIAYAYSSFDPVIVAVGHDSQMLSLGYAPGVLAGLFLLYNKKYWAGTTLTLVFSGLLIAQTHQQIVYYTLLIIGAIGIAFLVKCLREKQIKHFVIANVLAIVAIAGGFASNALMYLTTYEFSKESMRGGKTELTINPDGAKKPAGGLDKQYAFDWSFSMGETFTIVVPRLYGGSNTGKEITGDSKFAAKLQEVGVPEESALQSANGAAYWGGLPFTQGTIYLGAIVCFLFIVGLFLLDSWHKWWIAGIALFAIFLSWGKNFAGFNYFMFDYFPFYNKFRAPTMAMVIPQLVFPLLGGLALQQVLFNPSDKNLVWKKFKLSAYTMGAILVLLVGFYFTASFKGPKDSQMKENFVSSMLRQSQGKQPTPEMQQQANQVAQSMIKAIEDDRKGIMGADLLRSIFFIAAAMALLGLFLKDKIKAPVVLAGILLLSSIDVLAVGRRYLSDDNFIEATDYENNFAATPADNAIKADPGYFRVFDQTGGDPFADARASYFHNSLGGYLAARLGLYQDLMDNQLRKGNMAVFNMLNTKYFIQQNPQNGQVVAAPNQDAYGPCWLVKNIHYVKDGNEEMKALDSINLKENAIVQEKYKSQIPTAPAYDSTASIKLVRNVNDTIIYASSAKTNQFAVLSEIYYDKGWNAFIDGKKTDYLRVDYALRGLPIPAGEHTIEFKFEPQSYKIGNTLALIASLVAYILLLATAWFTWKKFKEESGTSVATAKK